MQRNSATTRRAVRGHGLGPMSGATAIGITAQGLRQGLRSAIRGLYHANERALASRPTAIRGAPVAVMQPADLRNG